MKEVLSGIDPGTYRPHILHDPARNWPETNCYVDLWIEMLSAQKLSPEALLGFTVRQDFEGDQFTFFKPPLEDIERLFDIRVTELAIFDDVETHVATQIERGRMVLAEVDSYWLPDTRGITYRASHGKTTIGINALDRDGRRMRYFHNAGFFQLEGDDYFGLFGRGNNVEGAIRLFPYAEFVKFPQLRRTPSAAESLQLLEYHLGFVPRENPFRAWYAAMPAHFENLLLRPPEYFHTYAFNTNRQIGANFELLASYLNWVSAPSYISLTAESEAARAISESAKVMQFQLARAMVRKKPQGILDMILTMADTYDTLMSRLGTRMGVKRAA
jgi:hypothetical protein